MLYLVADIALIAAGAVMLVRPRLFYELAEGWKHGGGAGGPSRLYLFHTRFGGVMCILAGICGLAAPLLSQGRR